MTVTPKTITKPWGSELWIADGTRTPYATKRILFLAGNQTSLQVHQYKLETFYVLEGTGILLISDDLFDVDLYIEGIMSPEEVTSHISKMRSVLLTPGIVFDVKPGQLHRVIATTDLTSIETSTCELDDVIRLQDDTNRVHGHIDAEHK